MLIVVFGLAMLGFGWSGTLGGRWTQAVQGAAGRPGCARRRLCVLLDPVRRAGAVTFSSSRARAGISTFDLSRFMGTSLAMIDRHYGHLARDGREHAIKLLDTYRAAEPLDVHAVDAAWTPSAMARRQP